MEATNNQLKFLQGEDLVNKMTFTDKAVQKRPKLLNERYEFQDNESFEKAQKMAEELKAKFPHMKPARIARKVAEYFHLKQQTQK